MYILEVLPITKSIRKESLTYFYSSEVAVGKTVVVPLRNREIKALVLFCDSAKNSRSALKQKDFALKKIIRVCEEQFIHTELLRACDIASKYHAAQTGAIIQSIIPAAILESDEQLVALQKIKKIPLLEEQPERYVIQEPIGERLGTYRQIIRTSFAQKKSIVVVCPTEADCESKKKLLSKGIEAHTFTLSSSLSKKKLLASWNECIAHEKPILIITTPKFFSVPRHDIGTIIIDNESDSSYISQQQPYTDYRIVIEQYTAQLQAKLYLTDIALRSETLLRYDHHEFIEEGSLSFRTITSIPTKIIDMKEQSKDAFMLLSKETKTLLTEHPQDSVFLYVARKGLAPTVSCQDCGTLVTCNECDAPMVLYGAKIITEKALFRCNQCGSSRKALEKCNYCDSWRLQLIGIGVESVAQAVAKLVPNRELYIIDGEHTSTHNKVKKVISTFYETPGAILIGTDMAMNYIHKAIPHIHVISIDALFTLPHYAIREKIMRTLAKLQNKATTSFVIQTRITKDPIFKNIQEGMLTNFYRDEFKARKQFGYPPFTVLIKISIAGTSDATERALTELQKQLIASDTNAENSVIYKSPYTIKQKTTRHLLIKVPTEKWPIAPIVAILKNTSPQFRISINPQNLF